ncbi:hypothetical protein NQL31_006414 [Lotmaria passim]
MRANTNRFANPARQHLPDLPPPLTLFLLPSPRPHALRPGALRWRSGQGKPPDPSAAASGGRVSPRTTPKPRQRRAGHPDERLGGNTAGRRKGQIEKRNSSLGKTAFSNPDNDKRRPAVGKQ